MPMNMRNDTLARDLALGFIAGALAVPTFHHLMVYLLTAAGMIQGNLYSMRPVPPFGVPTIVNQMFWGGLWGVVLGLIANSALRTWPLWLVGLLLGAIALPVVGWFVVAPIKSLPVAAGWNPTRMLASVIINAGWGFGAGLILMLLRNLLGARSTLRT